MGNNCGTLSLSSAPIAATTKNDVDLMLEQAQEEEKLNFKVLLLGKYATRLCPIEYIYLYIYNLILNLIRRWREREVDSSEAD